jgi:TetR/AcrR family transcriptional regulator, repressor of fatR-cypB operon
MARERKFSIEELFVTVRHILLQQGYEGFTFSLLAEKLNVSRGVLYKYYENKDELIIDFMIYEMEKYLIELREIEKQPGFEAKFDFLFDIMFKNTEIQQLMVAGQQVPVNLHDKVKEKKEKLDKLHFDMYKYLQDFIQCGRKEGRLKSHLPDSLVLGMIFQTIAIPNFHGIPQTEWVKSIKEILTEGMFKN